MKKKVFLVLLTCLVIALLVGLIFKRKHELEQTRKPKQYIPVVKVATVKSGKINVYVKYLGEIVPITESKISSKISGFVEKIFVDDGDLVKANDVLVKIDDRDIKARIASIEAKIYATKSNLKSMEAKIPGLKAALSTYKSIFERNKVLYKNKAIGKEELEISYKNFEVALSNLRATEENIKSLKYTIKSLEAEKKAEESLLDYTVIRSPFSGIVQRRMLSKGDIVVPGKVILTVVRPDDGVKVIVQVAPEDLLSIRAGTIAYVLLGDKVVKAQVNSIYPSTAENSLGICNILLEDSPFKFPYHTRVEVKLITRTPKGYVAPISCLLQKGDKNFIFLLDQKKIAHMIPVTILGQNEEYICFKSAKIHEGDRLICGRESSLIRIGDGQMVEVER